MVFHLDQDIYFYRCLLYTMEEAATKEPQRTSPCIAAFNRDNAKQYFSFMSSVRHLTSQQHLFCGFIIIYSLVSFVVRADNLLPQFLKYNII